MQGRVEFQLSSIHLLLGLKGKINGCHGRRMKAQEGRTDLHGWLPSSIFWKADILVIPHLLCSAHRFLRARNADLATSLSYLLWLLWTISLDTFFLSLSKKLKNVSISLSLPSTYPLPGSPLFSWNVFAQKTVCCWSSVSSNQQGHRFTMPVGCLSLVTVGREDQQWTRKSAITFQLLSPLSSSLSPLSLSLYVQAVTPYLS